MDSLSTVEKKSTQSVSITNCYKCIYCREPCQSSDGSSSSESCRRCAKNELKYGKPSVCHYCQLPAAFIGKLCQLCAHYQKHFGKPVKCRHCKLKAAFNKHLNENGSKKPVLCRLCKMTYSKSLAVAQEQRAKRKISTEEGALSAKKIHGTGSEQGSTTSTFASQYSAMKADSSAQNIKETLNDHLLAVTQLKDEISSLKRQLQLKDQEIFSRDKKTADLKAQILCQEKEFRAKISDLNKEHQNTNDVLQTKIKTLTKELASSKKSQKQK